MRKQEKILVEAVYRQWNSPPELCSPEGYIWVIKMSKPDSDYKLKKFVGVGNYIQDALEAALRSEQSWLINRALEQEDKLEYL